jgi:hypothetical protein
MLLIICPHTFLPPRHPRRPRGNLLYEQLPAIPPVRSTNDACQFAATMVARAYEAHMAAHFSDETKKIWQVAIKCKKDWDKLM